MSAESIGVSSDLLGCSVFVCVSIVGNSLGYKLGYGVGFSLGYCVGWILGYDVGDILGY